MQRRRGFAELWVAAALVLTLSLAVGCAGPTSPTSARADFVYPDQTAPTPVVLPARPNLGYPIPATHAPRPDAPAPPKLTAHRPPAPATRPPAAGLAATPAGGGDD